ncbi:hypothetical protein PsAD2_04192 [Pseudovibrio axinellae]|uniref:Glycosyltransferase RgtA/B/C/D-like domain-containing protein n=1 Tax=Pseudovibrio axinellae TaxID=989403 RepID=A0A161XBX3_9HYPH|nr:glycosyltransferase family 39 protein [Pseudovibrio axinellae]KZL06679.1 hypothetical protein PsAD2_04192 [Pseudovibrio axinellae]SER60600.1 Dolichyl-phosphate-mannose-protein mannosyltransferase [Pseudovibrio axinellae]
MREGTGAARFWWRPEGVFVLVTGYLLLHLVLRGYFSATLGTDDMFENVFVQELELGYQVRQPPLYEWMLYGVQKFLGPTIWSFLVLKYALVFCFAIFLYAVARQAIVSEKLAALSVFSYVAFYQIGFNLHEGVTHTAVLMATSAASVCCFIWLLKSKHFGAAVGLGVAVGLGMLSKHSYALVPAALVLAALSDRYWRTQIRFGSLVVAGLVALALYSPYLLWVMLGDRVFVGSALDVMREGDHSNWTARVLTGEFRLFVSVVGFSIPFLPVVCLVFFAGLFGSSEKKRWVFGRKDTGRLLLRVLLISIVLAVVGVLLSGAQYIKERHMHPVLFLLPLVVFYVISQARYSDRSLRVYSGILILLVGVVVGVRISGFLAPDKRMCGGYCRHMKPYAGLGEQLKARFPEMSKATIVSLDEYTGGNLRAVMPEARHVIQSFQPSSQQRQNCFVVWDMGDDGAKHQMRAALVRGGFDAQAIAGADNTITSNQIEVSWPHLWKGENFRKTTFGVALVQLDSPICR